MPMPTPLMETANAKLCCLSLKCSPMIAKVGTQDTPNPIPENVEKWRIRKYT